MGNTFWPLATAAMLAIPLAVLASRAAADEGMWTFDNFPAAKVKPLYGFAPDQKWLDRIREAQPEDPEFEARRVVSDLAVALQASLLVRNGPAPVADAFCASRLDAVGRGYGMLPPSVDAEAILDRALPA